MKVLVHTCLIGSTGYNNHARSFFTTLNKYHQVKVRNFTIGNSWVGYNTRPHNNEPYMTDEIKDMLYQQTLLNTDGSRTDYPLYNYDGNFKPDVHIVLMEADHYYYYDNYDGYKIAYNVWESTRYPEQFFNRLLHYNEVWVPSQWQLDCLVEQGYPKERIFIVPEGVDIETFKPLQEIPKKDKFRFLLFGRWDYRKSTGEILQTFTKVFKGMEDKVEMICSIENPYPYDGLNSTEDRLKKFGIDTTMLKIVNFPSREEYVKYLQEGDVFVSCARSEGWNLPLIESMSCGTPSIYSDFSGQLQFAKGKGIPVKILGLKPANIERKEFTGDYCEPDFEDLGKQMMSAYQNYNGARNFALQESQEIHENFSWDKVTQIASERLEQIPNKKNSPITIKLNFLDGAFVEIVNDNTFDYHIEFINKKNNFIEYSSDIKNNWWSKCSKQYYIDWRIKITGKDYYYEYDYNPTGRRVLISFESKSIGDTIAWIPYVEDFRKKHNCTVICSTFHNHLFKSLYPKIKFVLPGETVHDLYALYRIGLFKKDDIWDNSKHPLDPRNEPLQKLASDILGLDYMEVRPLFPNKNPKKKQVSIAIHSTAQAKYWNNPNGWQEVVDYLKSLDYEVLLLSNEEDGYMGNKTPTGVKQLKRGQIQDLVKVIQESQMFIGISSGLSWMSWAVGTPTILISGFTDDNIEPHENVYRIINKNVCHGCWNKHYFDPGDWNWCPEHKGTERIFECSKTITSEEVINNINKILNK